MLPTFSRRLPPLRLLMLAAAFVYVASSSLAAIAQGRGGGGAPGGGMSHNPFGGGNISTQPGNRPLSPPASNGNQSTMRGGLQLGPPGRWWDDRSFARTLGLDSVQQHRMDDIFNASKPSLVKLYKNLQHEESQLEKLTRARNPEEAQIFEEIDRVTQARGELEKANAHYLLTIRKEMTQEQISRLDDHRPTAE